ncbi:MAG: hypothetical protein M0000_13240 [Actinomycetota bacterium]|nr:hypothetical protein [Actinomycetota bacterium]
MSTKFSIVFCEWPMTTEGTPAELGRATAGILARRAAALSDEAIAGVRSELVLLERIPEDSTLSEVRDLLADAADAMARMHKVEAELVCLKGDWWLAADGRDVFPSNVAHTYIAALVASKITQAPIAGEELLGSSAPVSRQVNWCMPAQAVQSYRGVSAQTVQARYGVSAPALV